MSSLFAFVKSRLDYLDLNADMNRGEEVMDHLRRQCVGSMIQCVQKVSKIPLETATDITKIVKDCSTLQESDKYAFLVEPESRLNMNAAVGTDFAVSNNQTAGGNSNSTHMGKMQTCLSFRLLFWESVWQIIFDVDQPLTFVMKACSVFFKKLGINNPSEKTVQNLVATVVCARQQVTKIEIACDDRLAALRIFKDYLRNIPFQYEGPTLYCETPEQLKTRHPGLYAHAYSDEPPAKARLSEEDVQAELARTPMRGSTGKVASPMGSWHSLPRSSFHHVLSALRGCQNPVPSRSLTDDIGLTIFGTPRPAQPRLALADPFPQRPGAPGPPQDQGTPQLAAAVQQLPDSPKGQDLAPKADASVDNMLAHLSTKAGAVAGRAKAEAKARAASTPHPKATAKCAGRAKGKAKAKAAPKPHPKAKAKTSTKAKLVLGCSKCRYSSGGCRVCRTSAFTGKRGRP